VFYARFGEHFAPAIAGIAEADLDQDRQVSVLEAFLHASRRAAEFYQNEDRLATEHALLEDNGDGIGTRAEIFEGTQPKAAPAGAAPALARAGFCGVAFGRCLARSSQCRGSGARGRSADCGHARGQGLSFCAQWPMALQTNMG
jgi:hypothetical protein